MSERIRVLRIIARMNLGGPANAVTTLSRDLDVAEFDQLLVTGYCAEDEQDHIEMRAPDLPHVRVPGLGRAPHPWNDAAAAARLVAIARRFRPHIVHTHTAKAGALGRLVVAHRRGVRTVHTFHGHLLRGYFSPAVLRGVIGAERLLARRTDALVSVGSRVRDELLAAGIGRREQYTVVPPGLSVRAGPGREAARASLGIPSGAPVIGFVARLAHVKRPDRFAGIAARVAADLPDLHVVVCGGGELAEDLAARLAAFGPRAHLLGWRADVGLIYDACNVLALTSDNEGMPVSLIEAALSGRPAVTTDVGSAREVVLDGITGFVVDGEAAHAARLLRLLRDEPLARRMGAAARSHALTNFSESQLVSVTAQLYRDLLTGSR